MRLQMILPRVEPNEFKVPTACPYPSCGGKHLELHQTVIKPVKDTGYQAVSAHRYRCLCCKRTFRVYPQGVTRDQTSQRVKGLGVFLYLLGLSYGAVSLCPGRIISSAGILANQRVEWLRRDRHEAENPRGFRPE